MKPGKLQREHETIQFTLRLEPDVHKWLQVYAREQRRSVNSTIDVLLRSMKDLVQSAPPPNRNDCQTLDVVAG
jgi:hypothetical protein